MEFAFLNKEIRNICEDENKAKEDLGEEVARILKIRLADLFAATSVFDIILGDPKELITEGKFEFKVDICNGYQLIFSPNHVKNPLTRKNTIDWLKVNRIKIIKIDK